MGCSCKESGMIEVTWHACVHISTWASQMASVVKKPPANAGDAKAAILISGSGRFPGIGNYNLPQYSCLENSMERGTCWTTIYGATKSQTRTWLSD